MNKFFLMLVSLVVLSSCGTTGNDGEKVAKMYNESVENFINDRESAFDDFIDNFDDYNFSSRVDARNEIKSKIDELVARYENDKASADYAYEKCLRECAGDWEKISEFEESLSQNINKGVDVDKVIKEAYYNPNVDRLVYTIIPEKPNKEKLQNDLIGRVLVGNKYVEIKWLIAKGEIKELEILNIKKDGNDYIYDIRMIVQENGGALESKAEVRYHLGKNDDWTIEGVFSKELNQVITGKYNRYIEVYVDRYSTMIKNNYDRPLAVGGRYYTESRGWKNFYRVVSGNSEGLIGSFIDHYDIHFVELPHF